MPPPKKDRFDLLNQAFLEQFREVFNAHYKSYKSNLLYILTYSSFIYLFYLFYIQMFQFFPFGKNPLTYQQATEKLQATLRELEAVKVQLEAGGWLVGSDFWSYAIFLPFISHHAIEFHDVWFFRWWTLVFFSISGASFFSYASIWLPCIVICKYRSLQEQHT